ncbi:MAG: hypothetical protein C5B54_00660 [Acidobacteria bacterium]|nr:MAG: hypothetical protein C5B54_00660 [Acidobacteriota bacterium]
MHSRTGAGKSWMEGKSIFESHYHGSTTSGRIAYHSRRTRSQPPLYLAQMQSRISNPVSLIIFFLLISVPLFAYDLNQVRVEHFQNGLTVMVLEDHTLPLVSTQMLYRVGGRNECDGTTGVAHFVEHMAFRATKNFPKTDVVNRIYAAGGEWHGYTWIDETTYFETVPVQYVDLVLQIQADRMHNALINESEVEAERGAVLTELHSYENDPASLLNDAVLTTCFLEHPYRNNTIGWTSDVEHLQHDDIANFYHRYYNPSNAVLAIVGDIKTDEILQRVHRYFDVIPAGNSDSIPRTKEPPQIGERRINLNGPANSNYFQITYVAPAAQDSDYPIFLLLQSVLTGSSGINFIQHEDPEKAQPQTLLYGIGESIGSFICPSEQPYVFTIAGKTARDVSQTEIESSIENKIAALRNDLIPAEELERARKQLLFELVMDITNTENAAHQLAFFEGIHAFDVLQHLPELVNAVTPEAIRIVAQKYLQPHQRTIGWYLAGALPHPAALMKPSVKLNAATKPQTEEGNLISEPQIRKLKNKLPVIFQRVTHVPSGTLRILIPSDTVSSSAESVADEPVWRYTSLNWKFLEGELNQVIAAAQKSVAELKQEKPDEESDDPETRLNQTLPQLLGIVPTVGELHPAAIAIAGDFDEQQALISLENAFGKIPTARKLTPLKLQVTEKEKIVRIPGKPQSQLGYAIIAPPPSSRDSYAYRMLLYILTHDYGGRLGEELITKRGLVYYIGNNYNSDGTSAWISITTGVNPDKLNEVRKEFDRLLKDLANNPPSESELKEAKSYLIGRRLTGNQNNDELTAMALREYIDYGHVLTSAEFKTKVESVTQEQLDKIIPEFLKGVTAIVDTNP